MLGGVAVDSVHGPQRDLVGALVAQTMVQDPSEGRAIRTVQRVRVRRHGGQGFLCDSESERLREKEE